MLNHLLLQKLLFLTSINMYVTYTQKFELLGIVPIALGFITTELNHLVGYNIFWRFTTFMDTTKLLKILKYYKIIKEFYKVGNHESRFSRINKIFLEFSVLR